MSLRRRLPKSAFGLCFPRQKTEWKDTMTNANNMPTKKLPQTLPMKVALVGFLSLFKASVRQELFVDTVGQMQPVVRIRLVLFAEGLDAVVGKLDFVVCWRVDDDCRK